MLQMRSRIRDWARFAAIFGVGLVGCVVPPQPAPEALPEALPEAPPAVSVPPAAAPERDAALPGAELYERVRAAGLAVLANGHQVGSGWFADPDGWALTASHSIGLNDDVQVVTADGSRLAAEVVARDPGHDAALLRVDLDGKAVAFLRFTDADPDVTDVVHLFGHPVYRTGLLLRGAVARAETSYEFLGGPPRYVHVMHVSGNAPTGMSGGPWVDAEGAVVAMQSGMITVGKGVYTGVSFCAPREPLRSLAAGRADVPTTTLGSGFEELWQQPARTVARFPRNASGLLPRAILVGGAASAAGLTENDLIVSFGGERVESVRALLSLVRAAAPGDLVEAEVLRADSHARRTVTLELGQLTR